MAQKQMTKKTASTPTAKKSSKKGIGIGVGLTTAAVAAAGAYFLYGSKEAPKHRKQVKSWALKAKAEVLEKLEDAKEMSREEYEELVGSVAGAYSGLKKASRQDAADFAKEMKQHWKSIEKAAAPLKKTTKSAAKKAHIAVKKTAKKVVKKK